MSRKSSVAKQDTGKKSVSKEEPPKRPLSAYFLFLGENRERIVKAHPQAKISEISKIAGEEWSKVDDDTKKKYEKQHEERKKQYEKDKDAYEAKFGPIKNSKKKKNEKTEKAGKRKTK